MKTLLFLVLRLAILGASAFASNQTAPGSSAGAAPSIKRVGVVVSDGFELLDALGPFEALKQVQGHYYASIDIRNRRWDREGASGIQCSNGDLEVEVVLASFRTSAVEASSGVVLEPHFDLAQDPSAIHFDLLVLGHGSVDLADERSMAYVRNHHKNGGMLMTVCTASNVPAALGLLDQKEASTNSLVLEAYRAAFPSVRWVSLADNREQRFVQSTDRILTTAGITAGIDGTLHLVREWCGNEVAEATRECLEWPLGRIQHVLHDDDETETGTSASSATALAGEDL